MTDNDSGPSDEHTWDNQIAANTELFGQADLLEETAYKIIQDDRGNADTWERFSKAKAKADESRTIAYQDWMRLKRQIGN